jgi:hypothetical protein
MLVYVRKSDLPDVMRSLRTSAVTPTATTAGAAAASAAMIADDDDYEDAVDVDILGTDYSDPADPMEIASHGITFHDLAADNSSSELSAAATAAAATDVAEIDLEGIPPELSKRFRAEEQAVLQTEQDKKVSTALQWLTTALAAPVRVVTRCERGVCTPSLCVYTRCSICAVVYAVVCWLLGQTSTAATTSSSGCIQLLDTSCNACLTQAHALLRESALTVLALLLPSAATL